jgi:hypothetical protein
VLDDHSHYDVTHVLRHARLHVSHGTVYTALYALPRSDPGSESSACRPVTGKAT